MFRLDWFKGLIMDRCVLLTSTPEWVVSPRRAITRAQPTRELMSTTHTYPWLIPIITWCWQFPCLSTNILLIKSKSKLESRVIVVGVAMSPRNLGGKYRCRPHPRWRKCTHQFFPGTRACQSNGIRVASSLGDNIVDYVVCLKAEFLWYTVLSNENGEFYTYDIYPYLNRSVCLLMGSLSWWRFTLLFKREFPRVLMTWRTARAWISNVSSPM